MWDPGLTPDLLATGAAPSGCVVRFQGTIPDTRIGIMDIRRLDLNLLLMLDVLEREKNLSAAARRLGMSQPVASGNLAKLRAFFGDQLFLRTGRGMRPTPFLEDIIGPVRAVLEAIDRDILRKPTFDAANSERVFTITTSDIGVLVFVPPLLRCLRAQAPKASLRCVTMHHRELGDALDRGDVDVAIGYFPDLSSPSIAEDNLVEHPFTCIVRQDHPTIGSTVSLEQFLAADHLVVNEQGRSQEIVERRMRELRFERRVLLQMNHFMSVPQLIANSDMVAIVPASLGAWYAGTGLKMVPPPFVVPNIRLKQFWHRRRENDPAVRWLRTIINQQLRGRDPLLAMTPDYAGLINN
ncbi:PCP degradation transcriptional activation protein [Methylobacterium crusticola]|uniref:PCP degradation transcriptional activation protein n=1 Tax=Methylobacterium crusticola TaxID=1697972 RepID=A0ABQ4QZ57_9HYPH|nr:LysR family transcriptional regulator [Methylobacterium crusticola]GJD50538.1 PCP degradation transcriptional activation protein [Methylobacterium crusticola]